MKKSTRKTINYLSQYIGLKILRTKPVNCDGSYTHDDPILLVGFTSDGCIRYRHTGFDARLLGDKEYVLPLHFTDRNWITYKKALRAKNNPLNQWQGKKVKRTIPVKRNGDCSYMCSYSFEKAPTLVSASRHHLVIEHNDIGLEGRQSILGPDFANPSEWELAE